MKNVNREPLRHKLVSAAVTTSILSIVQFGLSQSEGNLIKLTGSVFWTILNFFLISPIMSRTGPPK